MPDANDFIDEAIYEDDNGHKKLVADDAAQWLVRNWKIITDKTTNEMYYWNGAYWKPEGEVAIKEFLESTVHKYLTRNSAGEIIDHVRRATFDDFDSTVPGFINLINGIYDIEQHKLIPHDPRFYFDYVIPTPYIPEAKCPKILGFIRDITEGDPQLIISVLEAMAYSLVPGMPIQRSIMLVGEGSNGKSTLLNVLRELLGPENVSNATIQSLTGNRFAVAWLRGKLANIAADLPSKALYDTGMFKALTGGDPVPGEMKRVQDPITINPGCKLYFSANQIPDTPDDSDAFYRRWLILEFKHKFPEGRDILPELTDSYELAGLLTLLLNNFVPVLVEQKRFTFAPSADEARATYQKRSNTVKAFVEERLKYNPEASIAKSALYQAYVDYCDSINLIKKPEVAFWRALKQLVSFDEFRPERGASPWIRGQELLPPADAKTIHNRVHRDNTLFSLYYNNIIQNYSSMVKNPCYPCEGSAENNEKFQKDGMTKSNAPGEGDLSGNPSLEAQTPPSLTNTQAQGKDTAQDDRAAEAKSVQMAVNAIIELLKKAPAGVLLGSAAGSWDLLSSALKAYGSGISQEQLDLAMRQLLKAGDIYETKPGVYKLVVAHEE